MIYVDGESQDLQNELKNTKTDLGGESYGQISGGCGLIRETGAGTRGWRVRVPGVVRGKQPGGAGTRG